MKLYYANGTCSLAPHIILREAGFDFQAERVDLKTKKTEHGVDFNTITAKSAVPALVLDNGEILTEGQVMLQYLADLKPEAGLAPKYGTFERVRLAEMLNFIATDIHKSFFAFFYGLGDDAKTAYGKKLNRHFAYLNEILSDKDYLMGTFTVADAYLYTVLTWTRLVKISLADFPALTAYMTRVEARPHVQAALKAEGLLDKKAA